MLDPSTGVAVAPPLPELLAEVRKLHDLARWQSDQMLDLTQALHERGERVGITRAILRGRRATHKVAA
jgi:hypothetical protein